MVDVPEQVVRRHGDVGVTRALCDRQGARERGGGAIEVSLGVPHQRRADDRPRLGRRWKRRHVQRPFVPVQAFGQVAAHQPERHRAPHDVRCLRTAALEKPGQRRAIGFEVVANTSQPLGLPGSDERLGCERRFMRAIPHEPFDGIFALAGRGERLGGVRPHGFEHLIQRTRRH